MIIRFLTRDDVPEHNKISSQAFVYSCDPCDPDSELPCEKVLGAFDDDNRTLFADLELYEKKCHYDGSLLSCAAVGGVAAKPEHRGKGAVKALFDALFRDTKYDVSILYPFSEPYYRKLGYERTGFALCATVPFTELADVGRNQDATLYEGKDPGKLLEIYNRCAGEYNLCFVRDSAEAFPDRPYLSQSFTYVWKDKAFATFSVDREKSTVFVREIYFDSPEGMLGITGFLRNYEANQKKVCFQNIPEGSPLLNCVRDMRNCEISLRSVGSARLLNPENVLRAHRYHGPAGQFTIQIDADIYAVSFSENGAEVRKNAGQPPDAVTDTARASQLLLCGFADPAYIPGLAVNDPDSDFFRQFPPKTTFFSDSL